MISGSRAGNGDRRDLEDDSPAASPGPQPVASAPCHDVKEMDEGHFRSVLPPMAPRHARHDTAYGRGSMKDISLREGCAKSALKNGETHRFGRSLMIPKPHRAISSPYTKRKNASMARPVKHRAVHAATPPRAATFEIEKTQKRRKEAPLVANAAARFDSARLERRVIGAAREQILHVEHAETTTGRSVYDSGGSLSTKLILTLVLDFQFHIDADYRPNNKMAYFASVVTLA